MVADWTQIVNIIPDVGLVLVFVWFVLERDKRDSERAASTMREWREYLSRILAEQNQIISEHARKIGELTVQISALSELVERCADQNHQPTRPTRPKQG